MDPKVPSSNLASKTSDDQPPNKKMKTEKVPARTADFAEERTREIQLPISKLKPELLKAWQHISSLDKTGLFAAPV